MAALAGDFERLAAKYAWLSTSQAEALVAATKPEEEPSICNGPADSVRLFWIGELEVRPGQAVELRPSWSQRPGSFDEIPEECVTSLALSKDAPATILPGQRKLTVSSDAPHGVQFEIRADIAGEVVTGNLRVVVPAAAPLVGTWRQQSIACDSDSTPRPDVIPSSHKTRVQELVIRADNTFSVTWLQPFESYYDYWGDYRWDAEQGTVEFAVDGGNRLPRAFDGAGKVRRDGDKLVFNDVDFGEPDRHYPTAGCEIVFRR